MGHLKTRLLFYAACRDRCHDYIKLSCVTARDLRPFFPTAASCFLFGIEFSLVFPFFDAETLVVSSENVTFRFDGGDSAVVVVSEVFETEFVFRV